MLSQWKTAYFQWAVFHTFFYFTSANKRQRWPKYTLCTTHSHPTSSDMFVQINATNDTQQSLSHACRPNNKDGLCCFSTKDTTENKKMKIWIKNNSQRFHFLVWTRSQPCFWHKSVPDILFIQFIRFLHYLSINSTRRKCNLSPEPCVQGLWVYLLNFSPTCLFSFSLKWKNSLSHRQIAVIVCRL